MKQRICISTMLPVRKVKVQRMTYYICLGLEAPVHSSTGGSLKNMS